MKVLAGKRFWWFAICVGLLLAAGGAPAQVPDEFTNLQVLPKEMGKRELINLMREFSGALGVRCSHCHVAKTPGSLEGMDFATDELEAKKVARAMMKMTGEINGKLLPTTGRPVTVRVTCITCHSGLARPVTLDGILVSAIEKGGVEAAEKRYRQLREEYYGAGSYDFSAGTLNAVAEMVAREKEDLEGAVALLKLNLEFHPDDVYTHMMLGQIHGTSGDKEAAVASLERALQLDPGNDRAKQMLERFRAP